MKPITTSYSLFFPWRVVKCHIARWTELIEYVHDPLGRRIAKKVNGTIVEKYLWQGMTRLLAVYDGADNLLMRFEYADERMPVAVITEGATYYLAYDQVGSLRVVADSAGGCGKKN